MRIGIGNTVPERVSLPGQSGGAPTPPGPPALAQVNNIYSMSFDGTNDFIDLGDSDDFSFGNSSTDSPFSISAWVNMTDATSFVTIAKDATSNREYVIRTLTDDKLYFYLLDNVNGGYIGRISSGTVTSYQGTYNGNSSSSGIKIYLNGSAVDNADYQGGSYTAMSNTTTSLNIGRQESGVGTFANGKIDEVAIFNTALTEQEVQSIYNATETGKTADLNDLSTPPVKWYRMGD
jgi:MSHA biogenesis protein MshQ